MGVLLWRYYSEDGWRRLVDDHRLPVTRIAAFDDPWECMVPVLNHLHRNRPTGDDVDIPAQPLDETVFAPVVAQRQRFASCWFADDHESIAMWDTYVQHGPRFAPLSGFRCGVALGVLFPDLNQLAHSVGATMSPVHYMRHDDLSTPVDVTRSDTFPFIKLWGYRHEREVRIVPPTSVVDVETGGDEMRGRVMGTDLMAAVSYVRVFAPEVDDEKRLIEEANGIVPAAKVGAASAYPNMFRKLDGKWRRLGTYPLAFIDRPLTSPPST